MHDFLIIGGGVIGLSLAWELAGRGKSVCVVDRDEPARGTSWVGAGIFPPPRTKASHDPMEVLRTASHQLHRRWSEQLRHETGIDNELRRTGGIYFARRNGEAAALRVEMLQAVEEGVEAQPLSATELAAREPALTALPERWKAAYWLPDEYQLRSPRHLQALQAACRGRGVDIRANSGVKALSVVDNKVQAARVGSDSLSANQYVLCCGPWSAKLLEPFDICLPVEPWRGQLILWKTEKPLVSSVINEGLRYFVPRQDGNMLTGATVEDVGFDCQTTNEAIEELVEYTLDLLPQLKRENYVQAWAGLRPKTPDGSPFMGRVPGFENLSVSAGHFRSGLHLSPVAAQLMADLLLEVDGELDAFPFRLNR